jgi:hypothetical protein
LDFFTKKGLEKTELKREGIMKKPLTFTMLLAVFAASLFFAATAFAVKPGKEVNPNGFPSGEHYNLNLNAKKSDYNCTSEASSFLKILRAFLTKKWEFLWSPARKDPRVRPIP